MVVLFLDVVTTAAILFVVAAGLLIVFGVLKIINFAHGGFLTVGGYAALVGRSLGLARWLAAPLALIVGLVLGAVVERLIVRPLYSRPLDAILGDLGAQHRRRAAHHAGLRARHQLRAEPGITARWRCSAPLIRCIGC